MAWGRKDDNDNDNDNGQQDCGACGGKGGGAGKQR